MLSIADITKKDYLMKSLLFSFVASLFIITSASAAVKVTSLPWNYRVSTNECNVPDAKSAFISYVNQFGKNVLKFMFYSQTSNLPVKVIVFALEPSYSNLVVNNKNIPIFTQVIYEPFHVMNKISKVGEIKPFTSLKLATSASGERVRLTGFDMTDVKNFECVLYK